MALPSKAKGLRASVPAVPSPGGRAPRRPGPISSPLSGPPVKTFNTIFKITFLVQNVHLFLERESVQIT